MHWMRRHARGRPPHPDVLTPAEWRVLEHLRQGLTNAEIADRTGLARNTVKHHVSSMLAKTGLDDREALARWPGAPAPASRLALARGRGAGLLAPLAWLRAHARAAGIAGAASVGLAALVLLAAAIPRALDGGGEAAVTATPPAVVATETGTPRAEITPTPTLSPDELPPVRYTGPQVGESIPIDFGAPHMQLMHYSGGPAPRVTGYTPEPLLTPPLVYNLNDDELWYVEHAAGWDARMSPFDDRLVVWGFHAIGGFYTGTTEPETVIVDLDRMTVERILPVSARDARWISPDVLTARVEASRERERRHSWLPGLYEIDLSEQTVTLVVATSSSGFLPDGTSFVFNVERDPPAGPTQIEMMDTATASTQEIFRTTENDDVSWLTWLRDSQYLFFDAHSNGIYHWRPGWTEARLLGTTELAVDALLPSPDGRWLAISDTEGVSLLSVDGDARLGPFEGTLPTSWSPDGQALTVIANYCRVESPRHTLAIVDPDDGTMRPVLPGLEHFVYFEWSPRGDISIAKGVADDVSALFVVDLGSDRADAIPWSETFEREGLNFDEFRPVWSPSGSWYYTFAHSTGKGGCERTYAD